MGIESNKELVTNFWRAFSEGKYEEVLGLLTEDATWWVAGTTALSGTYSKPEFAKLLGQVTPMAPKGLRVTPSCSRRRATGYRSKRSLTPSLATGVLTRISTHFMMVIRAGKFCAVREYLDTEHVTVTFAP